MDVLNAAVLHRKGKKWKSRWAILRTTSVSDSIGPTLMLYKDSSHAKKKQHKHILPLWRYAGSAVFNKVEKVENVLMIFTEANTILLAFENQTLLNTWQSCIQNEFGRETTFPVIVPPKQKLKVGESTLYIFNEFFSIVNDKSYRCAGRWPCLSLKRYAIIDGDFLLEMSHSAHSRGHTFRLKTRHSEEIAQTFDCIKEAERFDVKEKLQTQLNPGSSILLELCQDRRNTVDPTDQNVFHRAFLRVSNRFRKHKRARAATLGTQNNTRRDRLKEINQASTSVENGSISLDNTDGTSVTNDVKGTLAQEKRNISELPDDIDSTPNVLPYKGRSNSHGNFISDSSRHQARVKAIRKPEPLAAVIKTSESIAAVKPSPVKKVSATMGPVGRTLKSSAGSVSGISTGSRGVSICSDVFDDDPNESKNVRQSKSGPPVAPPRSPISLGIFEFPAKSSDVSDQEKEAGEREYLNKADLNEIAKRRTSENEHPGVSLRKKTGESSLLDEIDREIKRRTREGESLDENNLSSPLSADLPYQYNVDHSDNEDSSEAYVMLRTTDLVRGYPPGQIDAENKEKQNVIFPANSEIKSEAGRSNVDPGVHSPNFTQREEDGVDYQNVSRLANGCEVSDCTSRGRRNSSRRASSKHLSDPVVIERFVHAQQQLQNNIVTGSLRELPQEMNYVNVQGQDDNGGSSAAYVNMAASGPAARKLRKGKKPQPLNLNGSPINWDKYDDDDNIYHDVGPLIGNGRSGSSDGLGSYKNISDGSYENISGRPSRGYLNMPSPSHKKPSSMLNYVLVNGKAGPKGPAMISNRTNRTGSLNSVNSHKSDYSMIDEKATSLLQKTREQHWQRREEDAQAQLNTPRKTKKSQGD